MSPRIFITCLFAVSVASGFTCQGAGVVLYHEPVATYVELVRFNVYAQDSAYFATVTEPNGDQRRLWNEGIVAKIDVPVVGQEIDPATAQKQIKLIQSLYPKYPDYHSQLGQILAAWQNALAVQKSRIAAATPAAAPVPTTAPVSTSNLPTLNVKGVQYDEVKLTNIQGDSVSITYSAGVTTIPLKALTKEQIALLNKTSSEVTIPDDWDKKNTPPSYSNAHEDDDVKSLASLDRADVQIETIESVLKRRGYTFETPGGSRYCEYATKNEWRNLVGVEGSTNRITHIECVGGGLALLDKDDKQQMQRELFESFDELFECVPSIMPQHGEELKTWLHEQRSLTFDHNSFSDTKTSTVIGGLSVTYEFKKDLGVIAVHIDSASSQSSRPISDNGNTNSGKLTDQDAAENYLLIEWPDLKSILQSAKVEILFEAQKGGTPPPPLPKGPFTTAIRSWEEKGVGKVALIVQATGTLPKLQGVSIGMQCFGDTQNVRGASVEVYTKIMHLFDPGLLEWAYVQSNGMKSPFQGTFKTLRYIHEVGSDSFVDTILPTQ